MPVTRSVAAMFLSLLCCGLATPLAAADKPDAFALRTNDVVAFVGGTDVAMARTSGHLEALLAVKFPGARFRNFGWEGDTVFAQPRDVGFPPLAEHLKRTGATVIIMEYGRAEVLSGKKTVPEFVAAYEKLLNEFTKQTPRLILVTPAPFENGEAPLPDLSPRNIALADHADAIREVARRRGLPVVDLFAELHPATGEETLPRLTDNGLQFTPRGQALIARACARQLGFSELADRAGAPQKSGAWPNAAFEQLRQSVLEKNRLWFNYWRPQNWAFLGGDRTSQPSSRDHRDPKVRWFPAEMERYVPLIAEKEREMETLATPLRGVGR